jgi:acyl carrier protein
MLTAVRDGTARDKPSGGSQSNDLHSLEAEIAGLFREVNGHPEVKLDDDFFELGGDSFDAEDIMAALEQRFGVSLTVSTMLEAATPRALARVVFEARTKPNSSCIIRVQRKGIRTPLFVVHGISGDVAYAKRIAEILGPTRPIYGLRAIGLRAGETPISGVPRIAERYVSELRAVQAKGPYLLHGFCGGAFIAYEMAQQLRRAGESVSGLVMIDPPLDWRRSPFLVTSGRLWLGFLKFLASTRLRWSKLRSSLHFVRTDKFRRVSVARSLWHSLALYDPVPYPGEALMVYAGNSRDILLHPTRGLQTLMDRARFVQCGDTHSAVFKDDSLTLPETKAFIDSLDSV